MMIKKCKYNIKKKIPKKRKDSIVLIIFTFILFIGVRLDKCKDCYLSTYFFDGNNFNNQIPFAVFSAQVSISTLGIALIAILTGMLKDKIYGISIIKYLTNDRPFIFKHKTNIVVQLILIMISLICICFNYHNTLICIFFISIVITIIMVNDIFYIFKGDENLRNEIHNYIIGVVHGNKYIKNDLITDIINKLKNDTIENVQANNIILVKDDLDLLIEILKLIAKHKDNENILKIFEINVTLIFNNIFKERNTPKVLMALEKLNTIYNECNKLNQSPEHRNNKIYLSIYEGITYEMFDAIASLALTSYGCLEKLSIYTLYDNMNFQIKDVFCSINNSSVRFHSSKIYYAIKESCFENYNSEKIFYIKKKLFKDINDIIKINFFYEYKEEKIREVYKQLYEYTRILIYNFEEEILNCTFFEIIKENKDDPNYIQYKFTILIYLYYMIECENLVNIDLKDNLRKMVIANRQQIQEFISSNDDFIFTSSRINDIKDKLGWWEIYPEDNCKYLIMDLTVNEFIIFIVMENTWSEEILKQRITDLINGNEFSMYNQINKSGEILDKYKTFKGLFTTGGISEGNITQKIELLKHCIGTLYKESEINKSIEEGKKFLENQVKNQLRDIVIKSINKNLGIFNNKVDGKILNNKFVLISMNLDVFSFDNSNKELIFKNIERWIDTYIIEAIVFKIYDKIRREECSYYDENIVEKFLDIHNSCNCNTDTIIGYYNNFYGEMRNEFRSFQKNKNEIKSMDINHYIVAINSRKFYCKVTDIIVTLSEVNIDEFCNTLDKDYKNEYLINITNDIYLPFNKSEVKTYLSNKKRRIKIEVDADYGFGGENIGVGLFLKKNQMTKL